MEFERRFRISMVVFAILIAMVWLLMSSTPVVLAGREVDVRWMPTLVLGMFAFKAYIHRQAEKIRAEDESGAARRQ